ncbi:uncharacterized protein METZ01_LOCUS341401, partial [marine metagenome]
MSMKLKYEKLGHMLFIFPMFLLGVDPSIIYPS